MTAPVDDAVIWVKDPGDYADYEVIWTDWIRPGDSISSHTVAVQETGVEAVVVISSLVNPAGNVTVWLDGGGCGDHLPSGLSGHHSSGQAGDTPHIRPGEAHIRGSSMSEE
jgi:hypothetical protein